ncbi:MAG TPA: nuclear transport factor 2 family protein [Thermoleophilaceae bacterium]|nr:nuclear transport factor 2 family protein [Thermoleophilaceae bacterium]
MSGLLEAFRESYMASQESFRRLDFETTFKDLPDDVVWHPLPEIVDGRPLEGKAEVLKAFDAIAEQWPDWRTEISDITEPVPGLLRVRFRASGTGAVSGARTESDVIQEWDFRSQPLTIRERLA